MSPLASDFAFDLLVSLHSDAPATPVEPLQYVQTAVTRTIRGGREVLGPDQRVTVDQALKTVTLYPAYQSFLDDKVGSLEVGKLADLVVLDRNPRAVDPFEIGKIAVLETYIGGAMQSPA
jgi:predicted amidohydrolase YtcJ